MQTTGRVIRCFCVRCLFVGAAALILPSRLLAGVSPLQSDDVINALNEAQQALNEGRLMDALQRYQAAVEAAEKFTPTAADYLLSVQIHLQKSEVKEATQLADECVRLYPEEPHAYFARAEARLAAEDFPGANEDFVKTLQLDRNYSEAADKLWTLLDSRREHIVAIRTFQDFVKDAPDNIAFQYYLGWAYYKNGNRENAIAPLMAAVKLQPENWSIHKALIDALAEDSTWTAGDAKPVDSPAVRQYEALLADLEKQVPPPPTQIVKLYLAHHCTQSVIGPNPDVDLATLTDNPMREKAGKLLRELSLDNLEPATRKQVATELSLAGYYLEAAEQFNRVLPQYEQGSRDEMFIRFDYGKNLVRAKRYDQGIEQLQLALDLWRRLETKPPQACVFQLGKAHFLKGNREVAEEYLREYHRNLGGTVDAETLEYLATIYEEYGNYPRQVEMLQKLVNDEQTQQKTRQKSRLKLAEALYNNKNFDQCRVEALRVAREADLKTDDGRALEASARLLSAKAFIEDGRPIQALEQLKPLEATPAWNSDFSRVTAQALLLDRQPEKALEYIEKANSQGEGNAEADVEGLILQARILNELDRADEARAIFADVQKRQPKLTAGWNGLGHLEMAAADRALEQNNLDAAVGHLQTALANYREAAARAPSDPANLKNIGDAERQLARAETAVEAKQDRFRAVLLTSGIIAAGLLVVALLWIVLRGRWAERCFRQIFKLENDLKDAIREQVKTCWQDRWEKLSDDPFRGRVDFKLLKNKAERSDSRHLLDGANFGHLVAIIDAGWDDLEFNKRAVRDTRRVTVAALSYVGDCRNAIYHSRDLRQFSDMQRPGLLRRLWHSTQHNHLNHQVTSSIRMIRENFRLEPIASTEPPPRRSPAGLSAASP